MFKKIIPLAVALFGLTSFSYLDAQWVNPPQSPTGGNVAAPINVSNTSQVKTGALGTGPLAVFGHTLIESGSPQINFNDTTSGERDFWLHTNSSTFYLLGDRNNDGSWDTPHPARFYLGSVGSDDYVQFANRVRASAYCDQNGNNCITPGAAAAAETDPQVGALTASLWCRSNSAASQIICDQRAPMIQIGKVTLSHPSTQSGNSTANVTFPQPFTSTPQVMLSIANANFSNNCSNDGGTFEAWTAVRDSVHIEIRAHYMDGNGTCNGSQIDEVQWIAVGI